MSLPGSSDDDVYLPVTDNLRQQMVEDEGAKLNISGLLTLPQLKEDMTYIWNLKRRLDAAHPGCKLQVSLRRMDHENQFCVEVWGILGKISKATTETLFNKLNADAGWAAIGDWEMPLLRMQDNKAPSHQFVVQQPNLEITYYSSISDHGINRRQHMEPARATFIAKPTYADVLGPSYARPKTAASTVASKIKEARRQNDAQLEIAYKGAGQSKPAASGISY